MAKIKPGNLDPRAFILARGSFYIRDTKHGPVAQRWPKKRGKAQHGYDYYRQTEFGLAAHWATKPLDLDLKSAISTVHGSENVPRDFLIACMFGRGYIIDSQEGWDWPNYRDVTNNPQYVLDLIDDTPLSIIYRAEIGWITLHPGINGQVLTQTVDGPRWMDIPGTEPPPPPPGPTGPVVRSTKTSVSGTAPPMTRHVTMPDGVVAGDLLIVLIRVGGLGPPAMTPPAGWTEIHDDFYGIWYRVADGTEGASQPWTTNSGALTAHIAHRIDNFQGVPEKAIATRLFSWDPPSITPSWGMAPTLVIPLGNCRSSSGTLPSILSAPSGYENLIQVSQPGGTNTGAFISSANAVVEAATIDPPAFSPSSGGESVLVNTLAIRPPA